MQEGTMYVPLLVVSSFASSPRSYPRSVLSSFNVEAHKLRGSGIPGFAECMYVVKAESPETVSKLPFLSTT